MLATHEPTATIAVKDLQRARHFYEEQLGLKLESQRTDVPVLVVDSISQPSEN